MKWLGARNVLVGLALGGVLACALLRPPAAAAKAAPAPDATCGSLRAAPRAICSAYVNAGCLARQRQACVSLRKVYVKLTGSEFFPFEFTPTPMPTPTPTATPDTSVPAGLTAGSAVVFPKILADGARDTVVELTNTSNLPALAVQCFYGSTIVVDDAPQWHVTDFLITLTRQQPTHWAASAGRPVVPNDPNGSDGAGHDPGMIPAVAVPFAGELRCVEVDAADVPLGANALTGTATVFDADGDFTSYDAVPLRALAVDGDRTLRFDGVEYAACPAALRVTHPTDWSVVTGSAIVPIVANRLTLTPCAVNYELQLPTQSRAMLTMTDEFEEKVQLTVEVGFWADIALGELFPFHPFPDGLSGMWRQTVVRPEGRNCVGGGQSGQVCTSDSDCGSGTCTVVGLLGVLETTQLFGVGGDAVSDYGRVAHNLNTEGAQPGATMILPPPP